MDDPLRMLLVVRRGPIATIARGAELAGAAAVRCVRTFAADERFAEDVAAWRRRPGKVTLRARGGQWAPLLAETPHVLDGAAAGARGARGGEGGPRGAPGPPLRPRRAVRAAPGDDDRADAAAGARGT